MSVDRTGRGVCSVCRRPFGLIKDGTVRVHLNPDGPQVGYLKGERVTLRYCTGSHEPPLGEVCWSEVIANVLRDAGGLDVPPTRTPEDQRADVDLPPDIDVGVARERRQRADRIAAGGYWLDDHWDAWLPEAPDWHYHERNPCGACGPVSWRFADLDALTVGGRQLAFCPHCHATTTIHLVRYVPAA